MRKTLWSLALLGYVTFVVGCAEPTGKKPEPAPPAANTAATDEQAHDHDHDHGPDGHDHAHDEKGAATAGTPAPADAGTPAAAPTVTDPLLVPAAESEAPPAPEKAPE